ncbi:hypothetical protein LEN26_001116 [Aphanomyces euteiches]|nr:hypothetical protein LEN26_001116 [Aphanomyces euteiches]
MDMDAELALLLEEQEKFMQSGKASSVKLHSKKSTKQSEETPASSLPTPSSVVRSVVVERTPTRPLPMSSTQPTAGGFPSTKKTSVFGRRRQQTTPTAPASSSSAIPKDIQEDNNAAIAKMSLDEIKKAQAELQASLPPEILEMFRNRGKSSTASPSPAPSSSTPSLVPTSSTPSPVPARPAIQPGQSILPPEELSLQAPKDDESLREAVNKLPEDERLKHEWMMPLPEAPSAKEDDVRLDLDGKIIKATADTVPLHSGLFHHGLSPELAGYTTEELLMLARSQVSSQRSMTLRVLAKTLRQRTTAPTTAIALVARSACEESNQSVLLAGVDLLHACLVQSSLAVQLDSVSFSPIKVGEGHVVEYIDTEEVTNVTEIADPIQALCMTQFGSRLIELVHRQRDGQLQLLDIAVAISMHSRRAAAHVMESTNISTTLNSLLSVDSVDSLIRNQEVVAKALLWILRLCQADKVHAQHFHDEQVLASTKVFLAMRHSALLPLQVLTMRVWRVCLSYQIDQNSVTYLFPLLCGYSAQSLTQSIDSVPLEPWPEVMQDAILDAMIHLATPESMAFLPFFLNQASQRKSAHTLAFLKTVYPLHFQSTALEVDRFVDIWPSLRLESTLSHDEIREMVGLFDIVLANPHPSLTVDIGTVLAFLETYIPTLEDEAMATKASLLEFMTRHNRENARLRCWIQSVAYPLVRQTLPGQNVIVKELLASVFQNASLEAIYLALLSPLLPCSWTSCHTIFPEHGQDFPKGPISMSWVFTLFSRLHSMETKQETIVLKHLLAFLADIEATQPEVLATVPGTEKIVYLAHVYLWEAESFRDTHNQLHPLVQKYIEAADMSQLMTTTETIASMQQQSVANFISSLVDVFCNTSFGDVGLAWILTMYLQPSSIPLETRVALWNQVAQYQCLHLLQTVCDLTSSYVVEDTLLNAFMESLLRSQLTAEKGTSMYRMVIHHVGHFCFSGSLTASRKQTMLRQMLQKASSQLVDDVVQNPTNETTQEMLQHLLSLPDFIPYKDQLSTYLV